MEAHSEDIYVEDQRVIDEEEVSLLILLDFSPIIYVGTNLTDSFALKGVK